ncbi:thiamine pyrophosphate-binding protein [Dasania sp. GY-MA-18]|uniref:Thiamine pyrophosphate-binding protein n=1 Tax=Dasania phycosphaerae TaxID=2950436 RepID=A0A9J6RLG1_9GAMM|nr:MULTISPECIES: thiamine pyrophosphate-dependent enzyme [Dasania]MCR8922610.1 thiamine pyrophosphate-binding protein [Dasania sp. GY-MA-18]MCZ0865040.1 thiamine pyrophosphate-binding protein [Dasania phycosphaerae]MCZ0868766.1 thiamine pyrophosphate-binding protein [Dasania phycosphaerae]
MTATITGGEAIIAATIANGVDTIFGIPGAQIYPLFDGIYKNSLELIVPRHEQSAAYMAMGYAKSTGKTGVFSVVPGPGMLNTTAALCTAMGTCAPVVGLTGQVPSSFLGRGRGHLHELNDQNGTLKTIIKDALHIADAKDTSAIINSAFRKAHSGRPGPISVDMCWDTMATATEIEIGTGNEGIDQPTINLDEISTAIKIITNAKKPMIMCGAGAQHASEQVLALAELLNAPVTAFRSGRGVVPEDHPLGVPPIAARELWDSVDVLIGIGSRLEMPYMRWDDYLSYEEKPKGGPKLIRIDIDPAQMDIFKPDAAIIADSAAACRILHDQLVDKVKPDRDWPEKIAEAKALALKAIQKVQPQISFLEVIRQVLPRDGYYVPELSQMGFATWAGGMEFYQARTYISEGFQGTLGFGFPTALGVKVANPNKAVVSVTGDGGFMFGMQELITASQHHIGLVTIVFNNQAYGNVRRDQQLGFEGRLIGSELKTPDFMKMAESFDVAGYRVSTPDELRPALEKAINNNAPALIEVVTERGSEQSAWEFINMPKPPSTFL